MKRFGVIACCVSVVGFLVGLLGQRYWGDEADSRHDHSGEERRYDTPRLDEPPEVTAERIAVPAASDAGSFGVLVLDDDGHPVSAAGVVASGDAASASLQESQAVTDAKGEATVQFPGKERPWLSVTHAQYSCVLVPPDSAEWDGDKATVALSSRYPVSISLVDPAGTPILDGEVTLSGRWFAKSAQASLPASSFAGNSIRTVVCDRDGMATLEISTHTPYRLSARAAGYVQQGECYLEPGSERFEHHHEVIMLPVVVAGIEKRSADDGTHLPHLAFTSLSFKRPPKDGSFKLGIDDAVEGKLRRELSQRFGDHIEWRFGSVQSEADAPHEIELTYYCALRRQRYARNLVYYLLRDVSLACITEAIEPIPSAKLRQVSVSFVDESGRGKPPPTHWAVSGAVKFPYSSSADPDGLVATKELLLPDGVYKLYPEEDQLGMQMNTATRPFAPVEFVVGDESRSDVKVRMNREHRLGSFSLSVEDELGRRVVDWEAAVIRGDSWNTWRTRSDAGGGLTATLPAGRYKVWVFAFGYVLTRPKTIEIQSGRTTNQVLGVRSSPEVDPRQAVGWREELAELASALKEG